MKLFSLWFFVGAALSAEEALPNPVVLTISGAETGDRGCYVSGYEERDDGSTLARELMADFGCEDTLIAGRTYEIQWVEQGVLASSCQGDPDCPDQDIEPFVQSHREIGSPLTFESGRISTTVQGSVIRGEVAVHTFGAREGQHTSIAIAALENNAVFAFSHISNGEWKLIASARSWDGALPASDANQYRIEISGTRGNASYELFVGIAQH